MSVYVMSDIHGEAALFHGMLKQIQFSDEDILYILGDVIDRGPDGIALLQEIKDRPNMVMLRGNHEQMMLQCCKPQVSAFDYLRWNKNGNTETLKALRKLNVIDQKSIINYLAELPTHIEIVLENIPYYLVHAFPSDNPEEEVWKRPEMHERNPKPGCRVVVGHTPVLNLVVPREDRGRYIQHLERRKEHPQILFAPGFIDIDCGCSYPEPVKTLGCLRLNDLAEFYECSSTNEMESVQIVRKDAV